LRCWFIVVCEHIRDCTLLRPAELRINASTDLGDYPSIVSQDVGCRRWFEQIIGTMIFER